MADDLFDKLRARQGSGERSPYSFTGGNSGDSPFRRKPAKPTTPERGAPRPTAKSPGNARPRAPKRDRDGDRPAAYSPPATREQGVMYEYEPPMMREAFKELGLRMFEVILGAAARAAGDEVAYYFERRRFYTRQRRDRKEW